MAKKHSRLSEDQVQSIARAVADPRRFEILQHIAKSGCSPCSALRSQVCISPATISHHMKELSEAGLIVIEREGRTAALHFQRDLWESYLAQLADI